MGHIEGFALQTRLGQQDVEHEADDEGSHGRAGHLAGEAGDEIGRSDYKADRPGNPPCQIESRSGTGPFPTGQQVIGSHGAADGAEGSADDLEHADHVAGQAGDRQEDTYGRSAADRDEGIDLRQRGLEAIRSDEGREAGRREGGDGQQVHEDAGCFVAHDAGHHCGSPQDGVVGRFSTAEAAGDDQQRQSACKNRGQGDAHQSPKLHVLGITIVHTEVGPGRAGGGEETDDVGGNQGDYAKYGQRPGRLQRRATFLRDLFSSLDQSLGVKTAEASDRSKEEDRQNGQRDQGEKGGHSGYVLDAFEPHEGGRRRPDDTDYRMGDRQRTVPKGLAQQDPREKRIHAQPAELQHSHEEAGHKKPALHAVGRGAHNIERQTGLHTQQPRHEVEQKVAEQGRQDQSDKSDKEPVGENSPGESAVLAECRADSTTHGDVLPKHEPEHNARIGLCGVLVPCGAIFLRHGLRRGNIGRQIGSHSSPPATEL